MVTTETDIDKLYDAIAGIPDPEIPVITIHELGILRSVAMEGACCVVTITPTYTACPAMGLIEDQIREKLLQFDEVEQVRVKLTYAPAWTTDWISSAAKKKLQEYGIAPPAHSSCLASFKNIPVACPRCHSEKTALISRFGSTACKALYRCESCQEPFEYFKCLA
jgi:ring-1,2-phenylacetyl-CoA epoxidase subunit PaaD